jgi:hypothetical protein
MNGDSLGIDPPFWRFDGHFPSLERFEWTELILPSRASVWFHSGGLCLSLKNFLF